MRDINAIIGKDSLDIKMNATDGIMGFYYDPVTIKKYAFVFSWGGGWEHLSLSTPNKTPDWEVMCRAKDLFWEEEEVCVQYHPRKSDYVNNHKFCLHIWKPIGIELPTPPKEYV